MNNIDNSKHCEEDKQEGVGKQVHLTYQRVTVSAKAFSRMSIENVECVPQIEMGRILM